MANPLPSQLQTDETLKARQEFERAEKERGERRKDSRTIGRWNAKIITAEESFPCIVTDLSLTGARLQLVAQLYRLQEVRFELDSGLPLYAEVMWRTRSNIGIRFSDDSSSVAEVIRPLLSAAA